MVDQRARTRSREQTLGLAATMVLAGVVISLAAGILHPGATDPNDHAQVFREYADSQNWIGVHLGQFVGIAVLIAGLVFLYDAAPPGTPGPLALNRLGLLAAVTALALYGVLQAVDGVALKHAVDAWAGSSGADKAARFSTAEGVRWLEWAVRSYHSLLLGASFILFGASIVWTGQVARAIGYLMVLSGIAYLVQGWIIGMVGFAAENAIPTLAGIVLVLAWSVWLCVDAVRRARRTGHVGPTA